MGREVAIVVLNWNNAQDTLACLQSLETVTYAELMTIVVDNGSSDDSVHKIHSAYPGITMIKLQENLGYAAGNNVGIRYAMEHDAEYICI